jgi:hypothetical protein
MKYLLIVVALILAGCAKPVEEWTTHTTDMKDVRGFKGCSMSELSTGDRYLYIVRCPNSDVTTTTDGKNPETVSAIDHSIPLESSNGEHVVSLNDTVTEEQRLRFEAKERLDAAQYAYNKLITKHME